MSKCILSLVMIGFALSILAPAQEASKIHQPKLTAQDSGTTQGLIAVSPVNSRVVWASGRGGTFVLTTDGGKHWKAGVVPGAEALQFRDVQGFSDRVAYLQSIGDNPTDFRIYKTVDGGATWAMQFQNQNPGAFYDCFAFWTPKRGISHSDLSTECFPTCARPTEKPGRTSAATCRRLSRRIFIRVERNLCRHAGREKCLDHHGWRGFGQNSGDSRWRTLERLRHPTPQFAQCGRLYGRFPRFAAWHCRRRRSRSERPRQRADRDLARRRSNLDTHKRASRNGRHFRPELRRRSRGRRG